MNNVTRKLSKCVCSAALALAIFAMPVSSVAVEAASYGSTDGEMENVQATVGDGSVTFTWDWTEEFRAYDTGADYYADLYADEDLFGMLAWCYEVERPSDESVYICYTTLNVNEESYFVGGEDSVIGVNNWIEFAPSTTNTWTIDGLTNGQTYYFSCYGDFDAQVFPGLTPVAASQSVDKPEQDDTTTENSTENEPVLDNATQNNPVQNDEDAEVPVVNAGVQQEAVAEEVGPSSYELYIDSFIGEVAEAKAGTTVKLDGGKDMTALPNSIMQTLYQRGNVSLEFSFEYEDKEYTIVIPAGKAVNADIPWYGHQYLLNNYGK